MGSLIFIDTSAAVAVLTSEDEAEHFLSVIENADQKYTGAHVRLECVINLVRILGTNVTKAEALYDGLLEAASINVLPLDDTIGKAAVRAFDRFGKGRGHPAQLNFGDCLSYACASILGAAILFKGRDFIHSDLELA